MTEGHEGTPAHREHAQHPPDWTPSDTVLEEMIEEEEHEIRSNRLLIIGAFGVIALVIAALVMSVIALNRDITSVAKATPKDNSVSEKSIQDGAVTSTKLASGAVTSDKLAKGAVTSDAIAPGAVLDVALAPNAVLTKAIAAGAVTGKKVASNSLTGAQINESTLGKVPSAGSADKSNKANNAAKLGGVAAAAYLSAVKLVQVESGDDLQRTKQVTASCPSGMRVLAGGISLSGAVTGVALQQSAPAGETGWTALAVDAVQPANPWRLTVTAICANGG